VLSRGRSPRITTRRSLAPRPAGAGFAFVVTPHPRTASRMPGRRRVRTQVTHSGPRPGRGPHLITISAVATPHAWVKSKALSCPEVPTPMQHLTQPSCGLRRIADRSSLSPRQEIYDIVQQPAAGLAATSALSFAISALRAAVSSTGFFSPPTSPPTTSALTRRRYGFALGRSHVWKPG